MHESVEGVPGDWHSYSYWPYSPELNRIEGLWKKIKYSWMGAKCRNSEMLQNDIEAFLSNFETKYKYAF